MDVPFVGPGLQDDTGTEEIIVENSPEAETGKQPESVAVEQQKPTTVEGVAETIKEKIVENDSKVPGEQKEEETSTEKKIGIVDKKLDELLVLAGNSPEAYQEAVRIFVEQARQIGEQMKMVREAENLQELKLLMNKHWEELKAATGGDPELLASISKWGDDFVESKALYYDFMNEAKLEMNLKAAETNMKWTEIQLSIGNAVRNSFRPESHLNDIERILYHSYSPLNMIVQANGDWTLDPSKLRSGEKYTKLEKFIESVSSVESGYSASDIDVESLTGFHADIAKVIGYLAGKKDTDPEALKQMVEEVKELQQITKDILNAYMATKKLRENHFLGIFNQGGSSTTQTEQAPQ